MSSYNYNTISDSDGSLQEKFLEYSKTWEEQDYKEKKELKLLKIIMMIKQLIIQYILKN